MAKRPTGAEAAAGTYTVGYRRPPLETRFKKGQSGNPRGRPSGPKSVMRQLVEALAEQIVVVGEDGKRRRIAKRRLGITRLADRFAGGEPYAMRIVLDLLLQIERRPADATAKAPPRDAADRRVIQNFLAGLAAS